MKYSEARRNATDILLGAGIEEAEVDAEYLLQHASGLERSELFIRWNEEIPDDIEKKYADLIERRRSHEPLQYIIGNQDFMGYTFMVTPDVLIPRFDTEILAEHAIKRAKDDISKKFDIDNTKNVSKFDDIENQGGDNCIKRENPGVYKILDLCTGSGCVATSVGLGLAERLDHTIKKQTGIVMIDVTGADISSAAIDLAKKNWQFNHQDNANVIGINENNNGRNTRENNIGGSNDTDNNVRIINTTAKFIESDLFSSVNGKFHLITANPPYIVRNEIETLMPEITEHEPHLALDGGEDGMDFYRKIVREAPAYLYPGGRLMMEFDDLEAEPVAEMMKTPALLRLKYTEILQVSAESLKGHINKHLCQWLPINAPMEH